MVILPFFAISGIVLALYRAVEHLGFLALPITALSLSAMLAARFFLGKYPQKRLLITALLFLGLFHIVGFTAIAYQSLENAWGFYGDFHSSYAPTLIARETVLPPFLGLWFFEIRIFQLILHKDNMTLILFASLISRIAAFALFLWLSKALKTTDRGLLLGATALTFSYLLIPFTQGLKFVVGLPFFLLWLIGFLRTKNGGDKRWLALELGAGAVALFSEQWILLAIASLYVLAPSIKIATSKAWEVTAKDSLCALMIAVSAVILAGIEQVRFSEGIRPLLSLQAHAHREPHPDAIYALYFLFCIAAFTGCVITYRRTKNVFGFTGYGFVIFGFALPILLAIGKHLATMENIIGILKPISLYWILGFPFWLGIIHDAVRRKRVDTDTSIIMTLGSVACMLPIMPLFGIFIPLSPYLEALAFACIALCSYRIGDTPEEKLFPPVIYGIALIAMGGVWMFQFLEYAQGWERTGILLLITTAAPLCLIGTKTRPTTAI